MILDCAGRSLDLSSPKIMGILNVTPDSFSDGGNFLDVENALRQAERMMREGATVIDVGGESTRPGAQAVSVQQELDRVVPVVEAIVQNLDIVVSIDTSKAVVMREAVVAGAGMINDVRALREPGALEVAANCDIPICLMHMQGEPRSMQSNPQYLDVVDDVFEFLEERIEDCFKIGVNRKRLLVDPGFGFGKSLAHNLSLLKHLDVFSRLELPVLVGVSRKSMIGAMLNVDVHERLYGSIALAVMACQKGANIIRCHDVSEHAQALRIYHAVVSAQ